MLNKSILLLIAIALTGCHNQVKEPIIHQDNPQKGSVLFNNSGCTMCHSISGESRYGPPLNSILNSRILVLHDGKQDSVTIDREYIVRSIKDPGYEKDIRFPKKKMPKPDLSEDDIESIVDFIMMINEK